MRKFSKIILVSMVVFVVFVFAACKAKKSDSLSVETVLPKDASIVWTIDFSDEEQVENFNQILAKFPDTGLGSILSDGFMFGFDQDGFSWEEDFASIFEGEWSAAFSMTFPEELKSKEDFKTLQPWALGIYFVVKLENGEALRDLLNKMIEEKIGNWAKVKHEKKDGVDYWTSSDEPFYFIGYDDLFFVTLSEESVNEALDRLESGDGFNNNQNFLLKMDAMAPSNFGYMFLNKKIFNGFYKDFTAAVAGESSAKQLESMGDAFLFWVAEKDGFRLLARADLGENADLTNFVQDPDYKLSLVDKINGDGVFLYLENAGFGKSLDVFLQGFKAGLRRDLDSYDEVIESGTKNEVEFSVDPKSLQTDLISPEDEPEMIRPVSDTNLRNFVKDTLQNILNGVEIFFTKIDVLMDAPLAFSMSDSGGYLPTASIYFQLKEGNMEEAKKLISDLDVYIDDIIKMMDETVELNGGKPGVFKKDLEAVAGGGLHKLYVDFDALPDYDIADFKEFFGENFKEDFKMELYYGLTGNNTFVIAFYPDFPKFYGKSSLAKSAEYQASVAKLNDVYGSSVVYFRMQPLIGLLDRYVAMMEKTRELSEFEISIYESKVKAFLAAIEYFIGSMEVGKEGVDQMMFLKIE